MVPIGIVIAVLAAGSAVVAIRLGHTPESPRTYLYEDDDGERENPFVDLSAGAAADEARCAECGDAIESPTYRVCQSCVTGMTAGD